MSGLTTDDIVAASIERDASTGFENSNTVVGDSKFEASSPKSSLTSYLDSSGVADEVMNHPITQSVTHGPVVENVKHQHAKTQAEFSNLAASRTTPTNPAATGQPLTHYHSFFYSLLSWENPRASGTAYVASVLFIFAARYLDVIRYSLKLTYMVLGITVLAEAAGKALFSHGFTTQVRPKKYYTVSKETLNLLIGDLHELLNFFVIEVQRIAFAENLPASAAAFVAAFLSYFLVKFVPLWGLSLIATSTLFLGPLVYKANQEVIDYHISQATQIISEQTEQVKTLAGQHAARATESTKALVKDYSAKTQGLIGNARGRSVSPLPSAKPDFIKKEIKPTSLHADDFPAAPQEKLIAHAEEERLIST